MGYPLNAPVRKWPRREFLKTAGLVLGYATARGAASAALPPSSRRALDRIPGTRIRLSGWVQGYLTGVVEQWLKPAPASNPAILDMFADRDRQPLRDLVPWAGEFAGKYLTACVQVYRVTGDRPLLDSTRDFVARLLRLQADDGYLGPWPQGHHLTGEAPNCISHIAGAHSPVVIRPTWDAWGHYHIMVGLLLWSDETGDPAALRGATRIADLLCDTFADRRLVDTGSTEMNLAPIHSLCLLYERTGNPRHLALARRIEAEFAARDARGLPLAGDYVEGSLGGKPFFELPKPRWESLHSLMGVAELHAITGDPRLRDAFERLWWSIARYDRHNNGGFSSGEKACGDPYNPGAIETCCTIAWTALSVEMLRLTGDSVVADELELTALNSVLGLHSPNGRWVTYNTPMDGVRKASGQDIVFQAREGSPELSCCSVNGARGLVRISESALKRSADGLALNWYGPASFEAVVRNTRVALRQEKDYPREESVRLAVDPERPSSFALSLRIPFWSRRTSVALNGSPLPGARPGRYFRIDREWKAGDVLELSFDFGLQYWAGERECEGRTSIYRGPILLTCDRRHNPFDLDRIPALDAAAMELKPATFDGWLPPRMLWEATAKNGAPVRLCDFASAGFGGSPYRSWLPVERAPRAPFARSNPRRSAPAA